MTNRARSIKLVSELLSIKNVLVQSLDINSDYYRYLEQNPAIKSNIATFSRSLNRKLGRLSIKEAFANAILYMSSSFDKGRTLAHLLAQEENVSVLSYLEDSLDALMAVSVRFEAYLKRKEKLTVDSEKAIKLDDGLESSLELSPTDKEIVDARSDLPMSEHCEVFGMSSSFYHTFKKDKENVSTQSPLADNLAALHISKTTPVTKDGVKRTPSRPRIIENYIDEYIPTSGSKNMIATGFTNSRTKEVSLVSPMPVKAESKAQEKPKSSGWFRGYW